jgi:prevent-host-death family protein
VHSKAPAKPGRAPAPSPQFAVSGLTSLTRLIKLSHMRDTYSLYEAKAKLSAIVRKVRQGRSVIVTLHGEPVAEIRPVARTEGGLDARIDELAERGIVVRATSMTSPLRTVARRRGALDRFLAERD